MTDFFIYLLKSAGCLVVFYLFYKLLLSRDTLHRVNRVLLVGVFVLSLVLPFCVITITRELPQMIEILSPIESVEALPVPTEEPFDWATLLTVLYIAGIVVVLGSLVFGILKVVRTIRGGRKISLDGGRILVLIEESIVPFSWMKYVVMSEADWEQSGETILLHEQTHLRLGHSWDLLIVDLLGALQWFNPTMWLLRSELSALHEYEADKEVLRGGTNAKDYQLLLIKKAVGERWYSVANSLNHSKLKNRITMMLRKKSSRWAGVKALYVLPIVGVSLVAFARTAYAMPNVPQDKGNTIFEEVLEATQAPTPTATKVVKVETNAKTARNIKVVEPTKGVNEKGDTVNVIVYEIITIDDPKDKEGTADIEIKSDITITSIKLAESEDVGEKQALGINNADKTPLLIVNGKVVDYPAGDIDSNTIEQIAVYKDGSAVKAFADEYGKERVKNGVVVITLKTEESQ